MSAGVIVALAWFGLVGSMLLARWLGRAKPKVPMRFVPLPVVPLPFVPLPVVPPPVAPVDRTICETFAELGLVPPTERIPLEAMFPTPVERTEQLPVDPDWPES